MKEGKIIETNQREECVERGDFKHEENRSKREEKSSSAAPFLKNGFSFLD